MGQEKQCGKCNLCCKLMVIPDLDKPNNVWCTHCEIGKGCRIYETRPQMCRDFYCHYIMDRALGDDWHPARTHFVLRADDKVLIVQVDPQRPDAWKRAPYHAALRKHANKVYAAGGEIIVRIGDHGIAILPDRDVDLGHCGENDRVMTRQRFTPQGPRWEIKKVTADG